MLVDQHRLGEAGEVEHLGDRAAVFGGDPGRGAAGTAGVPAGAERHPAGHAIFAMAAESGEAGDDMVADLHRPDLGADRFHYARRLVAGDAGEGVGVGALDEMQIRMAQAAGGGADEDFARAGGVEVRLPDGERGAGGAEEGGFICRLREGGTPGVSPSLARPAVGSRLRGGR